jgi:uncharacterized membrane protein
MKLSRALTLLVLMAVAAAVYSLLIGPRLPETVPTHWNINGQPDQYGSKTIVMWLMPILILAFAGLTWLLPKISPKNYEVDRFGSTYHFLMTMIGALFLVLHVTIMQASESGAFEMQRVFPIAFGLFFMVLGNVLGKVQRNFWIGIRTPWTLADERVWDQTHRAAAKLWFFGGLVMAVLGLLNMPAVVSFGLLMLLALVPLIHSFVIWRKLQDKPEAV